MNPSTRFFTAGICAGTAATLLVSSTCALIARKVKPTPEFVEAKASVAKYYGVAQDDVKLFQYDLDSNIWSQIDPNCSTDFSNATGIYPGYIYTAKFDDHEKVLAVELVTEKKGDEAKVRICGHNGDFYERSSYFDEDGRRTPVWVTTLKITDMDANDLDTVISGIQAEISK